MTATAPLPLYLEDLSVGQTFTSTTATLSEAEVIAFARQFDPQPFHVDPAAAGSSFFGGLVASGWHTAALTMRLIVDSVPFADGVIGAGGEVSWPRPTRPGDRLHVVTTVEEIVPSRSRPDRGMARVRSNTVNQSGEVAQVLIAKLIVPRRVIPPGEGQ